MSRRASVVFFLMIGFVATAAFGQTAPTITMVKITQGDFNGQATPVSGASSYELTLTYTSLDGLRRAVAARADAALFRVPAGSVPANTPVEITVSAEIMEDGRARRLASAPVSSVSAPVAPTGVAGIGGRNKISISWNAASGAASYRVTLSNGMSFTTTSTTHVVTGLPNATSFNCIVWSYNAAGAQSPGSAPVVVRTANIALLD